MSTSSSCPNCGAPLGASDPTNPTASCIYCDSVFANPAYNPTHAALESERAAREAEHAERMRLYQMQSDFAAERMYQLGQQQRSAKDLTVTRLLALFIGWTGAHRFYVGKIGTGILWFFTFGCFGVGWLIDVISLFFGGFTDAWGFPLMNDNVMTSGRGLQRSCAVCGHEVYAGHRHCMHCGAEVMKWYETNWGRAVIVILVVIAIAIIM